MSAPIHIFTPACDAGGISSYVEGLAGALSRAGHDVRLAVWFDRSGPYHAKPRDFWNRYPCARVEFESLDRLDVLLRDVRGQTRIAPGEIVFSQSFPYIGAFLRGHGGVPPLGCTHLEFLHGVEDCWFDFALDALPSAAAYCCVAHAARERLKRLLAVAGAGEVPAILCPGAVDAVLPALPERPDAPFRFCYLGRLDPLVKRVFDLAPVVHGFGKLGIPFEVTVMGDGECQEELRNRLGGAPVRILGGVAHAEAMRELDRQHALVMMSASEGTPMALCEAMAHGVVPVATGVGGVLDVVDDGEDGFLFPVGETASCVRRLALLARDPARRRTMAAKALDKARRQLTWPARIERLNRLLADLPPGLPAGRPAFRGRGSLRRLLDRPGFPNALTRAVRSVHRTIRPLPADVSRAEPRRRRRITGGGASC